MENINLVNFNNSMNSIDLLPQAFDDFPSGVMVVNKETVVVYYNRAQGLLDDIEPQQAVGQTILDLYRVNGNHHYPTLHCLFTRKPLINNSCFYYTSLGKLINSIHSVFPLFNAGTLMGCICFVRDYGEIAAQYNKVTADAKLNEPKISTHPLHTFAEIITQDPVMLQGLAIISQSSNSPSPTMLYGETGCGKEMFAQALHNISNRSHQPFVALNCAAIPESLLEGMLFGTVKGAFTGSLDKPGMFEIADGGTIFLDEINSMPLGLQSKILRAIQDQKIRRVGSSKEKVVSLKIISASNTHPQKAVSTGALRADLFFRLGVVIVEIPPLRERVVDIPLLTNHFIDKHNKRLGKQVSQVEHQLLPAFSQYHWPGNVRELEHTLEGAMNLIGEEESTLKEIHFKSSLFGQYLSSLSSCDNQINPTDNNISLSSNQISSTSLPSEDLASKKEAEEVAQLTKAMEDANGNAAKAARSLSISPQLMNYKLKKYGIKKRIMVSIV